MDRKKINKWIIQFKAQMARAKLSYFEHIMGRPRSLEKMGDVVKVGRKKERPGHFTVHGPHPVHGLAQFGSWLWKRQMAEFIAFNSSKRKVRRRGKT